MKSHRGGLAHACCVTLLHEAAMSFYSSALKIAPDFCYNQWRTEVGGWGVQTPLPEILKALQNRAKLNPIVKIAKNC